MTNNAIESLKIIALEIEKKGDISLMDSFVREVIVLTDINYNPKSDDDIKSAFNQIKEVILCMK